MIERMQLPGLAAVKPKFLADAFTYEGHEYFVEQRRFRVWRVVKLASDGHPEAEAEYAVRQERSGLTCDCFSGRRHLECRHKEMARMASGQGTHAPVTRNTRGTRGDPVQGVTPSPGSMNPRALLERARKLLGKA